LIEVVLPIRKYDIKSTIELIFWIQQKNHKAYLSHRKKRLKEIKNVQKIIEDS
jgi:hypothetical protein